MNTNTYFVHEYNFEAAKIALLKRKSPSLQRDQLLSELLQMGKIPCTAIPCTETSQYVNQKLLHDTLQVQLVMLCMQFIFQDFLYCFLFQTQRVEDT